jgi:hypothetical protein
MAAIENPELDRALGSTNVVSISKSTIDDVYSLIFRTTDGRKNTFKYVDETTRDTAYNTEKAKL